MNYNKTSYLCVICGAVILAIGVLLLLSLDKNDNSLCEQQIEHAEFPVGINQGARDADRVVIAAKQAQLPLVAGDQTNQDAVSMPFARPACNADIPRIASDKNQIMDALLNQP